MINPAIGPARVALLGWLVVWVSRWFVSPQRHRRMVATCLKVLHRLHGVLPGRRFQRWCMRVHRRSFKATLKKPHPVRAGLVGQSGCS